MTSLIPEYTRIKCYKCGMPIGWAEEKQSLSAICDNCANDEWHVLHWLGITSMPCNHGFLSVDKERMQKHMRKTKSKQLYQNVYKKFI